MREMSGSITLQKKHIFSERFNESHKGECLISVSLDYFILFHSGCVPTSRVADCLNHVGDNRQEARAANNNYDSGGKENS